MFYLKINVSKIYPIAVVPNLFVTSDLSMHDNCTAAREYSMMLARFQQPKWSYQYESLDKAAAVQSAAFLYLQHSHFMLQYSHSIHPAVLPREKWTNYMPRYLPFRKGSNGADVSFHNNIIGNFIVCQDRIETDLLKLCAHPENSEWFSVISVIIVEVKLLLNRNKHNWQWFFAFYKFPLRSTILLPPVLTLLQRPWFHIFEHWTADVKKTISTLLVQFIKKMRHC